nr:unnamed protein product [Callosobruchus analis]
MGFPLPLRDGLPETDSYLATTGNVIESHFQTNVKAHYACVIMVQPIKYSVPAYCLSVFATDNKFKAEDVTKRCAYIRQTFLDLGVTVLGFSSDGDTRYLKAMRISSELPLSSDRAHLSQWEWFHIDSMSKDCCYVQDSVHILTKLRTKLTKPSVVLPMGQYFASVSHLYELLSQFSKDKHLLTPSDLKAEDKMNYDAAKRMCSTNVIQLLEKIPNTEGTVVYLKLMNAVITAFIEEDISVYERLHSIWYCAFFMRMWRADVTKKAGFTLKDNFISSNSYTCVELNAHYLLKMIKICRDIGNPSLFMPTLFSSQSCEKMFRAARSITSTFSTVINFSIKDLIERIQRIRLILKITSDLKDSYVFPRESHTSQKVHEALHFSDGDLTAIMKTALNKAILDAEKLKFGEVLVSHWKRTGVLSTSCSTEGEEGYDDITVDKPTDEMECNPDTNPDDNAIIDDVLYMTGSTTEINLKGFAVDEKSADFFRKGPYIPIKNKSGNIIIVKNTSLSWLLGNKEKVDNDRLNRFIIKARKSHRNEVVSTVVIRNDLFIGDWCLFCRGMSNDNIGRIIGFKNIKNNKYLYLESVKVSGTEVGPDDGKIVCVCAWYGVVKTEEKFTLSPTTSPEFFISLKHYKCTLPHPDYETNDDKILLVYKENIINDISRLTSPAPERSCHKDATESDLKNANSDKTNLLLPVKSQITPQITNDQEHTSEAGISTMSENMWVVVSYKLNKLEKKYIGRIVQVDLDTKKAKVNFLKQKQSSLHFIWPEMEDVDDVSLYDITILPEPTFHQQGRSRGYYSFPENILKQI